MRIREKRLRWLSRKSDRRRPCVLLPNSVAFRLNERGADLRSAAAGRPRPAAWAGGDAPSRDRGTSAGRGPEVRSPNPLFAFYTARMRLYSLLAVLLLLSACASTHDVVIRNGLVHDGSGNEPFVGDVAI